MRSMLLKLREDGGMAMVTAIMAGMVVLTLSTVGFQLATHNLDQSAGNRRDVQTIHAAEAGLDRFLDYLANTAPVAGPACAYPFTGTSETLATEPVTTFSVTATYYATTYGTGTPLA